MQKLERNTDLVESVKDAIFNAILIGQLVPGEKLSQDVLAERLGVSRQPIGQALRILLEHGIVCPLDKKSLTVAAIEHDSLMQIIDIRCELDCFAARLAADRAKAGAFDDAGLATLEALQHLKEKHGSEDTGVSFDAAVLDDIEFHSLIRKLSGNGYIQSMMAPYLLHQHRLMYMASNNRRPKIWAEHNLILEAIEAGDAEKAQALVRGHIVDAAEVLRSRIIS